jgi:hypothetical protein
VSPKFLLFLIYFVLIPWILAPVAAYLWSRSRRTYQSPDWLRLFTGVQILDLAQGVVFTVLSSIHLNNQWFRHFVQPIIYTGLLLTLFRMAPGPRSRRIIYAFCLGVGWAAAIGGIALNGLKWRNALFSSISSLVFLGLGAWELRRMVLADDDTPLTSLPGFWFTAALLVYGSGTLIFNASSNYFLRTLSPDLVLIPWVMINMVLLIYHVLLAKVFLCKNPASS